MQIDSRFSDAKKIPGIGLDQWMNLATKIVVEQMRKNQLSVPRDFVLSLHLAPYTSKKQSVIMIKLCKSIFNKFEYKKDT